MAVYLNSDHQLLQDFNDGIPEAFVDINDRYFKAIYIYSSQFLIDKADAKDITNYVLSKLFEKRQVLVFETLDDISSFLYVAARNKCVDRLRQLKIESDRNKELILHIQDEREFINDRLDIALLQAVVKRSIEQLPARQREAIELLFNQDLKYKEVAQKMNISVFTVKKLRSKGLIMLRKTLYLKKMADLLLFVGACILPIFS